MLELLLSAPRLAMPDFEVRQNSFVLRPMALRVPLLLFVAVSVSDASYQSLQMMPSLIPSPCVHS